jgi:hypothetical protein
MFGVEVFEGVEAGALVQSSEPALEPGPDCSATKAGRFFDSEPRP